MNTEKCACHIVLPNGTKIAIKDSKARAELLKKVEKIPHKKADLNGSTGILYGTIADEEGSTEIGVCYSVLPIDGDIVQRTFNGNIGLPDDEHINNVHYAVSKGFVIDQINSIKSNVQSFKNSINIAGASKFIRSTSENNKSPIYTKFGIILYDNYNNEYTVMFEIPLGIANYRYDSISASWADIFNFYFDKNGMRYAHSTDFTDGVGIRITATKDEGSFNIGYSVTVDNLIGSINKVRIEKICEVFN